MQVHCIGSRCSAASGLTAARIAYIRIGKPQLGGSCAVDLFPMVLYTRDSFQFFSSVAPRHLR
jgi:hypothetical protein